MIWGFSGREATLEGIQACVGPGWSKLLKELVEDLLRIGWDGQVNQVKEKFGGLRFYIGGVNHGIADKVYDRIGMAEEESLRTCEKCGEKGDAVRVGGWWLTLCKRHAPPEEED